MKIQTVSFVGTTLLATTLATTLTVSAQSADPGWPRVFKKDKKQLTLKQQQQAIANT